MKRSIIIIALITILISITIFEFWILFKCKKKEKSKETFDVHESRIPKIFMQTSKAKPDQYIIDKIKANAEDWDYFHYDDDEIRQFFKDYPLKDFENITEKFNSINGGAHKADLFRYYFLYIKGGVFMDSDAMIEKNMNDIIKNCDFFTVESIHEKTMFQGFIGATPKHEIIRKALINAYNVEPNVLMDDYLYLCRYLYTCIHEEMPYDSRVKLYKEKWSDEHKYGISYDPNNEDDPILFHYGVTKIIPK
jgi:hypothetical protein